MFDMSEGLYECFVFISEAVFVSQDMERVDDTLNLFVIDPHL